jgi:2-keto-3-deoxy-L-rhamnonate aldolase RhmA
VVRDYVARGATFIGVGSDTVLLAKATQQMAASYVVTP